MGKIRLLRTDSPHRTEVILETEDTNNEVIIGRGLALKCDDKRVSRNHCLLRILPDGGILLIAKHSNPCFYKVQSQSTTFALLPRNESISLYPGDEFSLLPESFRYRLSINQEQNGDGDPVVAGATNEVLDTTLNCEDNSEEVANFPAMASTSFTGDNLPGRVLPDWLTNLPQSNITPPLSKARKRKMEQQKSPIDKKQKNLYNESCRDNANVLNQQTSRMTTITETREDINVMDTAITETSATRNSPLPQLLSETVPGNVQPTQSNNKEDYEESWGASGLARVKIEPGVEPQVNFEPALNPVTIKQEPIQDEPVTIKQEPIQDELVNEEPAEGTSNHAGFDQGASSSNTTAPAAAASAREMCLYGLACYRRNPQHRTDFSHPGDPEYDAAVENLTECEYGTSCYRKNVQHRKDFKHTKKLSPPPQPRQRPPQANNTARLGDTSDEDEYDLNDSFLNDASSDDYQPSGSSGYSEEDSEAMEDSQADSQPNPEKKKRRKRRVPK